MRAAATRGRDRFGRPVPAAMLLPSWSPQVSRYPAGCLHSSTSTTPTAPVTKKELFMYVITDTQIVLNSMFQKVQ